MTRVLLAVLTLELFASTRASAWGEEQTRAGEESARDQQPSGWTAKASSARGAAGTFEELLGQAMPSVDLDTLISAFMEDCTGSRRPIDKARCRGVTSFLRGTMPDSTYASIVTDPEAVAVSEYDARIKGFRVSAVGCLACKQPVSVGKGDVKRMVTLRMPDKSARTLTAGLDVAQASFSFDDVAASKTWLTQVRPHLRAQFVFEPSEKQWTFGPSRGFAFNLLGARIFDHCTGEVLYSQPKSEGAGPKYSEGQECRGGGETVAEEASSLPLKLAPSDITRALNQVRPELDRCHQQFKLRGRADLDITVAGATGLPTSVVIRGSLGGTALGQCLTEAARKAVFPKFQQDDQNFSYPILFKQN